MKKKKQLPHKLVVSMLTRERYVFRIEKLSKLQNIYPYLQSAKDTKVDDYINMVCMYWSAQ